MGRNQTPEREPPIDGVKMKKDPQPVLRQK